MDAPTEADPVDGSPPGSSPLPALCTLQVTMNSITVEARHPDTRMFSFEISHGGARVRHLPAVDVAVDVYTFPLLNPEAQYRIAVCALATASGVQWGGSREEVQRRVRGRLRELAQTYHAARPAHLDVSTEAFGLEVEDMLPQLYVTSRHLLGDWLTRNPSNFLWTTEFGVDFYAKLYHHGLFTLPHRCPKGFA